MPQRSVVRRENSFVSGPKGIIANFKAFKDLYIKY